MFKKFAAILLILPILLSGCGNQIDSLRSAPIVTTGIIENIEISNSIPGTHKLATTQGDEYYLRSKSYNLNEYTNEIFKIEGTLSLERGYKVIQVDNIGNPEETKIEISLTTGDNNMLGFTVKLPDNWIVSENAATGISNIKESNTIYAELRKLGNETLEPEKWIISRGFEKFDALPTTDTGLKIYQVSPLNIYIFNKLNQIFNLELKTSDKKIQDKIISGFKSAKFDTSSIKTTSTNKDPIPFPEPDSPSSSYTKEPTKSTTNKTNSTTVSNTPKEYTEEELKNILSPGTREFQSTRYGYSLDYPKNWYYRIDGASGDILQMVVFAPTLEEENNIVTARLYNKSNSPSTQSSTHTTYARKDIDNYTVIVSTSIDAFKSLVSDIASSVRLSN